MKKMILSLSFLGVFLMLCVYFFPFLQGKTLQQSDIKGWKGMIHETKQFQDKTGEHTYWTGNLFSGMPTITFGASKSSNWLSYPLKIFDWVPSPIFMLFITFCGFFFLLRIFGVSHWLSVIGGLGYMLSSYFLIIIAVGHNTKMQAISFMAFVIAGVVLTYRKKYLLGGVLFSLFLSLHIRANHPQITYYLLFLVLSYGLWQLIASLREKQMRAFVKASIVLVLGGIVALGSNSESLYKLYDYSKVSTRGKQIIEDGKTKNEEDLTYATEWSYGKGETLTLLIPNLKGGASNGRTLTKDSKTYEALRKLRVKQPEEVMKGIPLYWGKQLFTEGGVYVGALVFFFFLLGLFIIKGHVKWWLITVSLLAILLAWGRNFMGVYRFFYDYIPLFSKFRNPSMILVLVEFTMPLLAFLALDKYLKEGISSKEMQQKLIWSAGITLFLCLIFAIAPSLSGDFIGERDGQLPELLRNALVADRKAMLQNDALRSLFFVFVSFLLLVFYIKRKLDVKYVYLSIGLLLLIDMWGIDKRFLNFNNFIPSTDTGEIVPYFSDKEILKDKDLSYRVLDITENPFNSSRASYFHKSIGGYNAAKLRRYQDLISYSLNNELQTLVSGLKSQREINEVVAELPALRMLNLRYLIYNPQAPPLRTEMGLGNAWFVRNIKEVNTPLEEIKAIETTDVANTAIICKEQMAGIDKVEKLDTLGLVKMIDYQPNKLLYKESSKSGGLAVFSEIYHPDWIARVDNHVVPIIRVNYALMALELPKGEHKILLEFKPKRYDIWYVIGIVSSLILFILLGILLFQWIKSRKEVMSLK